MTHIAYDVSRLLTRLLRSTPNGIDRVDFLFASHILRAGADAAAVVATAGRPLVIDAEASAALLRALDARWREAPASAPLDPELARVRAFLGYDDAEAPPAQPKPPSRQASAILPMLPRIVGAARRMRGAPRLYLNISQFPLWVRCPFRWLGDAPQTKGVFFIHDLLPISMPEAFPSGEAARHRHRLQTFARFGAAAIVSTPAVAGELADYLRGIGRANCPIHVAPLPVAPIFAAPRADRPCAARPFFVLCSTLEPRKNHAMILGVWSRLAARHGSRAPALVLVGKRGWKVRPVIDLLESNPSLRPHVIETNSLSTPGLKSLLDDARALLMPTFAEGYGLPVYEGLTAGVPVVASDIPAFAAIEADGLVRLSPTDSEAWEAAIVAFATSKRAVSRLIRPSLDRKSYLAGIDAFLTCL